MNCGPVRGFVVYVSKLPWRFLAQQPQHHHLPIRGAGRGSIDPGGAHRFLPEGRQPGAFRCGPLGIQRGDLRSLLHRAARQPQLSLGEPEPDDSGIGGGVHVPLLRLQPGGVSVACSGRNASESTVPRLVRGEYRRRHRCRRARDRAGRAAKHHARQVVRAEGF
ncbi:hypothetical protein BC936DRAFT_149583 [Jimgerdemannia flammicorona]|uniref:Uncharacterized protein n=1 Tax=Jimgerdemannia flammicorona TaxID=994334 RepID=A0A433D0K0_9FUNG|nr:hypothetical protein BC936DRAFT_149583 [Jimgerdemannia flammicorona]